MLSNLTNFNIYKNFFTFFFFLLILWNDCYLKRNYISFFSNKRIIKNIKYLFLFIIYIYFSCIVLLSYFNINKKNVGKENINFINNLEEWLFFICKDKGLEEVYDWNNNLNERLCACEDQEDDEEDKEQEDRNLNKHSLDLVIQKNVVIKKDKIIEAGNLIPINTNISIRVPIALLLKDNPKNTLIILSKNKQKEIIEKSETLELAKEEMEKYSRQKLVNNFNYTKEIWDSIIRERAFFIFNCSEYDELKALQKSGDWLKKKYKKNFIKFTYLRKEGGMLALKIIKVYKKIEWTKFFINFLKKWLKKKLINYFIKKLEKRLNLLSKQLYVLNKKQLILKKKQKQFLEYMKKYKDCCNNITNIKNKNYLKVMKKIEIFDKSIAIARFLHNESYRDIQRHDLLKDFYKDLKLLPYGSSNIQI